MSYQKSRARATFEQQLIESQVQLGSIRVKLGRRHAGEDNLLGAYYVLCFSHLEVYLRSFVEDAVQAFRVATPELSSWPEPMLGYLIHKAADLGSDYRRYQVSEDEGGLLSAVGVLGKKLGAWGQGGPAAAVLTAAMVLEKKKYPSPRNVPQLFKRFGITDAWACINRAGKFNGVLVLTSLNDLRTNIAHEGRVPTPFTYRDFKKNLEQMKKFVGAVDRGVSGHFCQALMTRSQWNTEMTAISSAP